MLLKQHKHDKLSTKLDPKPQEVNEWSSDSAIIQRGEKKILRSTSQMKTIPKGASNAEMKTKMVMILMRDTCLTVRDQENMKTEDHALHRVRMRSNRVKTKVMKRNL